jgi:lipopolysaccharide export LptBFGC system permease protein LptF
MIIEIKKQITKILGIGLAVMLVFLSQGRLLAEEKKEEKIRTTSVMKEVEGEISAIGKDYIAVVYERDNTKGEEYEILLPIDKDIKLVRKKSLDQIGVGDKVSIQYEELTEEYKEGPKQKRRAKIISFVKPAEKKPEAVESETSVLNSGKPEEGELPLKGIKGQ